MRVFTKRLDQLFSRYKNLGDVVRKLNDANIVWVMGGSGALYVQGNDRQPGDIDIYIRDDQHDQVDKLFGIKSIYNESAMDSARISYPSNDKLISIHTGYAIGKQKQAYPTRAERFSDGKKIYHRIIQTEYGPFYVLKAEDILLIKALLKRGKNQGNKRDLEDIAFFRRSEHLDKSYLEKRFRQMKVDQATKDLIVGVS